MFIIKDEVAFLGVSCIIKIVILFVNRNQSIEVEPEDDIDFTATDEDGLNVELLLEDDVFLDEDTDILPTTDDDLDDFSKLDIDTGTKINDPVKMYLKEISENEAFDTTILPLGDGVALSYKKI